MGIADDMKKLGEDIAASYDMRVKALEELVKDTHKMLKGFQNEHKEMAANLRRGLEQGEADRLNAFQSMMAEIQEGVKEIENTTRKLMGDIQARQKERNAEVADLLEAFKTERENMAANWQALTATMVERRGIKSISGE